MLAFHIWFSEFSWKQHFMETRADPPESAAIWKVLNVCPLCSNLHVLRPFREVHGRFFFSDGK